MDKLARLRKSNYGYIFGEVLTPFCTDEEVLEVANLKDRVAEIHNAALERMDSKKKVEYLKYLKESY